MREHQYTEASDDDQTECLQEGISHLGIFHFRAPAADVSHSNGMDYPDMHRRHPADRRMRRQNPQSQDVATSRARLASLV